MPYPYGSNPYYPVRGSQVAPGVGGPVVQNPVSVYGNSPQAWAEYVISQVPGLSPGQQDYLRATYAGGGVPTYEGLVSAGVASPPQPLFPGGPLPPMDVSGGSAGLDLYNQVMGLGMVGASQYQPVVPGDPVGPGRAVVGPASGGNLTPQPPLGPRVGPDSGGNIGRPAPVSTDVSGNVPRPISRPPAEDYPVYATNMAAVGPARQPHIGVGAALAESSLGGFTPAGPNSLDPVNPASPVKYIGLPKRRIGGFVY